MTNSFNLAMCQIETEIWQLDDNLERSVQALRLAKEQGADFAVCPECVLHGYATNFIYDQREAYYKRIIEIAETLDGERIGVLKSLAAELALDFVFGFVEKGEGNIAHNSAALFRRDGSIGNVYRKVHCRPFESAWQAGAYTPGNEFSTYDLSFGDCDLKAGSIICFDRERVESFLSMRHLGAEFIACPLATDTFNIAAPMDQHSNELQTMAFAATTESYIAVVNHAGQINGGSFLIAPDGTCVHQMSSEPGVKVLEVDLQALRALRAEPYGWRGYGFTRPDVYAKYQPEKIDGPN